MSEEDTQRTAESEARGAELRENIALTDARRAEEEVAKAQAEKEAAEKKEEKLSRKERRLRDKAERVHAEADRQRADADATTEATETARAASSPGVGTTSGPDAAASAAGGQASPPFPGADKLPPAAQRTEVVVGAAFAGSFILARILKRIFD
jgi:septal ring factor EnvC (AmiA/AmiB activator)